MAACWPRRVRFRAHNVHVSEAADQQAVFDLMRERLIELFGPGGSFRITLGRPTADDAVFTETVAQTIAWSVAASLESRPARMSQTASSHAAPSSMREHEELWREIEEQLLIRRTGDDALEVSLPATHSRRAAA